MGGIDDMRREFEEMQVLRETFQMHSTFVHTLWPLVCEDSKIRSHLTPEQRTAADEAFAVVNEDIAGILREFVRRKRKRPALKVVED